MNYITNTLTLEQRIVLLRQAKGVCRSWWVDILDCSKSFCRQKINMTFEEVMSKYDGSHISAIVRNNHGEEYLEIGFRAGKPLEPEYFLWLVIDPKHIPELMKDISCQ